VIRIAIRGYIGGVKQFEELVDGDAADVEALAENYSARLLALPGGDRHAIEIEFPDLVEIRAGRAFLGKRIFTPPAAASRP
jgi:hypothetical protein